MWLSAACLIWLIYRHKRLGWYLACMWAVPFALHSLVFDWKFSRYVAHLFPIFALALSPAIVDAGAWLWKAAKSRVGTGRAAEALLALVFFLCVAGLSWPALAQTVWTVPKDTSPAWRDAYAYVQQHHRSGDAIVTSVPLSAAYYLNSPADYYLDNYAYVDFRHKMKQDAQGRWIDWYSGIPIISNDEEFSGAVRQHPHGWVVMDSDRFNSPAAMPEDVRLWLIDVGRKHPATIDDSVIVYEWDVR
jgi:hypothetical protein